jgi:hypothetical protein
MNYYYVNLTQDIHYQLIMKMKLILILILISPIILDAQNEKGIKAKGEYLTKFETNNVELFKSKCIELARINAIENTFGKVIMQGNSTYIQNSTNNLKNENYNSFNFISDTYVNGEWLNDIEKPKIEYITQKGSNNEDELWIKASVFGYISELKSTPVDFNFITLSCDNGINCETETYKAGQDLFSMFISPVSGYLSIYIDVPAENKTYKILPYKNSINISSIKVEADKEYIFFSKNKNLLKDSVDEVFAILSNKNIPEVNKIFVLFSPENNINKPILNINNKTNENFEFPDSINSLEFQKWIQKNKSFNKQLQIFTKFITINP